eukprot:TRINITY_DN5719_c0_g1_i1.p1 TRINITY_DN5719_c0_g1~~TRINITY_DN5719_c0_g1_i1.p1  ORF type:complete len:221 (-),score=32.08 TRINITY_DN5719_c0_g1_i1:466-1128(-)
MSFTSRSFVWETTGWLVCLLVLSWVIMIRTFRLMRGSEQLARPEGRLIEAVVAFLGSLVPFVNFIALLVAMYTKYGTQRVQKAVLIGCTIAPSLVAAVLAMCVTMFGGAPGYHALSAYDIYYGSFRIICGVSFGTFVFVGLVMFNATLLSMEQQPRPVGRVVPSCCVGILSFADVSRRIIAVCEAAAKRVSYGSALASMIANVLVISVTVLLHLRWLLFG